jgi:recombination protein RecT
MNTAAAQPAQPKPTSNVPTLAEEFNVLRPELEKVLPAHITVDKFMRVVNTALSQNPDIYRAAQASTYGKRSLFTACVKCATDGLVPDGREAALVIYNTKVKFTDDQGVKKEAWFQLIQYMPMVYGIRKKIRQSGELKDFTDNAVFEADEFQYWIDDDGEHILHKPNLEASDRGKVKGSYAIAKTHDGGKYTQVMTRSQIEQCRAASKAPNGPAWGAWYDEMAIKSVVRRISKKLPMSTDLERVIRRIDDDFDLRQRRTATSQSGVDAAKQLLGISPSAAALGHDGGDDDANFNYDGDTGEVIENGEPLQQSQQSTAGATQQKAHVQVYTEEAAIAKVRECTTKSQADGVMASIVADYRAAGKSVPLPVDGAFQDRLAAIEQAAKKK